MKHNLRSLTAELEDLRKYEAMRNADNERLIRDLETLTREN